MEAKNTTVWSDHDDVEKNVNDSDEFDSEDDQNNAV